MKNPRRARLEVAVVEGLKELRARKLRQLLRGWRDVNGADRALLFGYNESKPDKPYFTVLVDRSGSEFANTKFRGRDAADADSQALQHLASTGALSDVA